MKKLFLSMLMPLAVLTASAQSNDYNMVIELNNGTKITLGADDVKDLTFNGDALSISGNTIEDITSAIANNKTEIDELRAMISQLKDKADPPLIKTFTANGISFKMVHVSGGTFQMGATSEQGSDADDIEKPVHSVTLSNYYIGKIEVTQALWQAVMGSNPSCFTDDSRCPVENVSWNDCQTFISKLNELTGEQFRLPTEAEWEFAARGGNGSQGYKYAGSNTISGVAWYNDNSSSNSHPVAKKSANELGLYDMSGNVWEWCQDMYGSYGKGAQYNPTGSASGSDRVIRGGGWRNAAGQCRVSCRSYRSPLEVYDNVGLRLAL